MSGNEGFGRNPRAEEAMVYVSALEVAELAMRPTLHDRHPARVRIRRLIEAFRKVDSENASLDEVLNLKRGKGRVETGNQRTADRYIATWVESARADGCGLHKAEGGAFWVVAERINSGAIYIPDKLRRAVPRSADGIEKAYKRHRNRSDWPYPNK